MQDINKSLEEAGISKEELIKSLEDSGLRQSALLLKNWHELDIHSSEALEKMCSMKKAIKPGPALNYAEMNKRPARPSEESARTIDYAAMNKPQQKPVDESTAPTIDYAAMNKPQPVEGPTMDYRTHKTPKPKVENVAQFKAQLQDARTKAGLGAPPPKKGVQTIQERVATQRKETQVAAKKIRGEE